MSRRIMGVLYVVMSPAARAGRGVKGLADQEKSERVVFQLYTSRVGLASYCAVRKGRAGYGDSSADVMRAVSP